MTTLPTDAELGDVTKYPTEMKPRFLALRQFIEDLLGTDSAAAGLPRNARLAKTDAYTVANADKGKTIACASTPWALTFNAVAGYDAGFIAMVLNESTTRALRVVVTGGTDFWLYPGQTATVYRQDAAWRVVRPPRWKLTANTTIYVDGTNGNNSNDGLASGSGNALATVQAAWDRLVQDVDQAGFTATIQIADATYTAGLNITAPQNGGPVLINGNSGTPSNVVISTTSAIAIRCTAALPAAVTVQNLKVQTTTGGDCIYVVGAGAKIIVGTGVVFGACAGAHIYAAFGGSISLRGSYSIVGGATFHMLTPGGMIDAAGITITLTGTPAFSTAFAYAGALGNISVYSPNTTYSGSATGTRYVATANGVISVFGGGASYFPGNSAGSTSAGGQYS